MALFLDISTWNEKKFLNTGGTRSKCIVEHPKTEELYYFKTSLKKEVIDYKYEFWSEIIASEYGCLLGFNMLQYDIALKDGECGCISKAMNEKDNENLAEGIRFLTRYDNTYQPDDKNSHERYTFDFICKALKEFELDHYIPNIIQVIIFDSLIGNGDRHQENWGIINSVNIEITTESKKYTLFEALKNGWNEKNKEPKLNFNIVLNDRFAPIYDSGSCLGREIADEKVRVMLKDDQMLQAYINRGCSEIRLDGPKLNHFVLVRKLKEQYPDVVDTIINNVVMHFDELIVRNIVFNVDMALPRELFIYKLPDERKEFILKMITLRFKKLKEILG